MPEAAAVGRQVVDLQWQTTLPRAGFFQTSSSKRFARANQRHDVGT